MGLKTLKCRTSKRQPAARRYRIIKRIAEHKRKQKKEANKLPKKKSMKSKLIQIPNICPFKEEILNEAKEEKQRVENVRQEKKELLKQERLLKKSVPTSLDSMVVDAGIREEEYKANEIDDVDDEDGLASGGKGKENSLKAFFKEFKKVVDAADVILEIVDARDPLGTRCQEVQEFVRNASGNKRLVLVLNKADLVPRENLEGWLKHFRKQGPAIPFKATTQTQKQRLGRIKFKSKPEFQRSPCVGADILTSLLANYCRNNDIKTSIHVGVVGIPNVGKSSIINSLKRKKACNVGGVPGVTRQIQMVEIDKNIKLLDSPGIIFQRPTKENPDEFFALKNAQNINTIQNPFPLAEDILKRASMTYFCRLYNISEFHSVDEFLARKAQKIGRFGSGGVPDIKAAARSLIHDWNTGKIKYFTHPPQENLTDIHLGAAIVSKEVQEFGMDNYDDTVGAILDRIEIKVKNEKDPDTEDLYMEFESKGVVHLKTQKTKKQKNEAEIIENLDDSMEEQKPLKKKSNNDDSSNKKDPIFKIDGNMSINKSNKKEVKRLKKQKTRNEKKMSNVSNILESFSLGESSNKKKLSGNDDYDFDEDFDM